MTKSPHRKTIRPGERYNRAAAEFLIGAECLLMGRRAKVIQARFNNSEVFFKGSELIAWLDSLPVKELAGT